MGDPGKAADEVQRAAELTPELRTIRAKIIKSLVRLAAAEPPRAAAAPEVELEHRRADLKRILRDLSARLTEFKAAIDQAPKRASHEAVASLKLGEASEDAGAKVDQLLQEVDAASKTRLERMPEEAREPVAELINQWCPIPKIFVAVHGIGDQFQNATVQSVAFRVCDYVGEPPALPMGRFHGPNATVTGAFVPEAGRDPSIDCGFAEIYWADVPRRPAAGHILEEPKKWARSLLSRLSLRSKMEAQAKAARSGGGESVEAPPIDRLAAIHQEKDNERIAAIRQEEDNERIAKLLEEMIQGVAIADRVVFLADKAGLFKFNLKTLLNDYLNDVQVVAEFEEYREELLKIFDEVLEKIRRYFSKSEIYIVAHSEGAVVAFMGLLKGLSEGKPWVPMIRGLMTIGSPINKHVYFWPELFDQFQSNEAQPLLGPIPWKNYYDYGDPIGYNLKPTRAWLEKSRWAPFFAFNDRDDIGFTRYYFPGAAHNDYWRDPEVFGHFIETVVKLRNGEASRVSTRDYQRPSFDKAPSTIPFAAITSYSLPYLLAALLLLIACYPLYRTMRAYLDPKGAEHEAVKEIIRNVVGLAGLIASMSLLARIPVLARTAKWRVWALALATLCSLLYLTFMSPDHQRSIGKFLVEGWATTPPFLASDHWSPLTNWFNLGLLGALVVSLAMLRWIRILRPVMRTLLPVLACVLLLRVGGAWIAQTLPTRSGAIAVSLSSLGVVLTAWAIGLASWSTFWRYPHVGVKPLVHTGALVIAIVLISQAAYGSGPTQDSAAWPVLFAAAAFLYLWWLAIIMFDLTFVWHRYIRYSCAQKYIEDRLQGKA